MEEMDGEEAFEPTRMEEGSRVPAGDLTQDDAQAIVESLSYPLDTISAGHAAGRPHKRKDSLLDGRDEERRKNIDTGGGSGPTVASGVHQFQLSGEESRMPSSSGHPREAARDTGILNRCGGRQNVQHLSSLQVDGVKHKIFISHSGAQKDFAEQLCLDLERRGFLCPFFDQRQHSLPKGKDFVPLIKEATRHCDVAVMVLSEEFLCSKWPMIELAEFHGAQQAGNPRLDMLPLFYKLSVKDLDERAIEERWLPMWRQLADNDVRINVAKWSCAVRALWKANGVVFGEKGPSELAYRKDIVQSIFRLSPPDLLYGSSRKMVGYSRVCQVVCDRFVRATDGGPSFLGLYGTSGVGKTTLSKALCDEFCREYMGRVCHVDLGEGRRMGKAWDEDLNATLRLRRVKRMLERLCGLDREALERVTDFDEGLMEMQRHMKREPVFLAIDNVTNENSSWDEARDYLEVGFHGESRIVITSRSKHNVWDLVPDISFFVAMPSLSVADAGELFLRSAAPSMSIFGLSAKERRVVGLCIQQCMYYDPDQSGFAISIGEDESDLTSEVSVDMLWQRSYHPMALSALGDTLRRYFSNGDMLRWTGYLEEKDPLWDVWNLPYGMGGIFGLQFHSLPSSEQLLFLDISLFNREISVKNMGGIISMLCRVHEETHPVMERRLQDLERSGMITLNWDIYGGVSGIIMHDIYDRFAEWHMKNHGVKWLKNAWCVLKSQGSTSVGDSVALDLVRLRMDDVSLASSSVLASKKMQELHNLEVLVLDSCSYVRELNLEGLASLRFLRIREMKNLESVTLSRSHGTTKSGGIFDTLECVILDSLESLLHGPDVRRCTSLDIFIFHHCPRMSNMDGMECPHLTKLWLTSLVGHQLARLPNVKALPSLEFIVVLAHCSVIFSDVEASRGVKLRDLEKPYLRVVEEVVMYLRTEWVVNNIGFRARGFFFSWNNSSRSGEELTLYDYNGMVY